MLNGLRAAVVVLALLPALIFKPAPAWAGPPLEDILDRYDELWDQEITSGLYYRMVAEDDDQEIMVTGRRIEVGDQYLAGDNRLYEVVRVADRTGYARHLRTIASATAVSPPVGNRGAVSAGPVSPVQAQPTRRIAVFHTHNGESYVPTRGTPNVEGRGDIHLVGAAFREALQQQGVEVLHAQEIHLPHDRGAYRRSRDTAVGLLTRAPDAVFDIHRDAAPWDAYAVQVDGRWVAQIMFVVGRQNPHFDVNRSFAFDLKNFVNQVHPGLVRGVLVANGNYNQDLHPLKLLLEVGGHENTRRAAEEGVTLFADGVGLYLYGTDPGRPGQAPVWMRDRLPAWRNIILFLLLVGVAGVGFYWLNFPEPNN